MVRRQRPGALALLSAIVVVATAGPAKAHVQLVESTPADQTILSVRPSTLELVFNSAMEPSGPGVVLSHAGGATLPARVSQPVGHRLLVEPGIALPDGDYMLSWTVRAGDSHPRSGSIGFVLDSQAAGAAREGQVRPPERQVHAGGHVSSESMPLSEDAGQLASAEWAGRLARWASMLGALLGIGVLAFAFSSLTGSLYEVRTAAFWVRRAGLAVIVGSASEALATSALLFGGWGPGLAPAGVASTLEGPFGWAVLLKLLGGAGMLFGAQLAVTTVAGAGTVAHSVGGPTDGGAVAVQAGPGVHRLNVGKSPWALAGAALVSVSYLFDGHTVIAEPTWLVRIADVAHVLGAGVWVGGVTLMAWVLNRRRRKRLALRAGELAIRFSTVAAAALVVVAAGGLLLAWSILDSPGQLLSTGFGRLLIAKLLVVALAAGIGGYNHWRIVPLLATRSADRAASERLRAAVRAEAGLLVLAVGITAAMVVAGTGDAPPG